MLKEHPPALPADFDAEAYLLLNPDVARAGIDPREHYAAHGAREGRRYRTLGPQRNPALEYLSSPPSRQAVLDLFAGEWSSAMPAGSGLHTAPGHAGVFEDARISFLNQHLGPVAGASVLEIGPLEGGHGYQLQKLGAASVVSVEANKRSFLKCLCVKEVFGLDRVRFLLGDALAYLEQTSARHDIILASGILYHMTEPLRLLGNAAARTDRLFIWTHYYDPAPLRAHPERTLFGPPQALQPGLPWQGARRSYPREALSWAGFSGGSEQYAIWLTRETILGFLRAQGFSRIEIGFDDPDHPNGPAFALAARRG